MADLTPVEQEAIRDLLIPVVKNWLANELPAPYTAISKADAVVVFYLAAQKFQEDLLQEPL